MFRGVAKSFAMFLVVVMVVGVSPSLALPHNPYSLTDEELIATIVMNQLKLRKTMNETTSSFAAHGVELNQLRDVMEEEWQAMEEVLEGMNDDMNKEMNGTLREVRVLSEKVENEIKRLNESSMAAKNEVNDKLERMNETLWTGMTALSETMNNEIQRLNETGESRARAMSEMNTKIQSMETEIDNKIDAVNQTLQRGMDEMNEKRMSDTQRVMEKLEAVQNAAAIHRHRPNPADLYVRHNDTYGSLCDGHKVLYGGRGILKVTSAEDQTYESNLDCSWTVTLPEGSRPVFRWYIFDLEYCDGCTCDYISLRDFYHIHGESYCGVNKPDGSYLTVMSNKFTVTFHSDHSVTGKGFMLKYRAVENN